MTFPCAVPDTPRRAQGARHRLATPDAMGGHSLMLASGLRRGGVLRRAPSPFPCEGASMNNLIYIIGLVVVIIAILSFFGLR